MSKESKESKGDMGYTVELWVYDLSHGMARAMSPQLLGKQIDGVWHTGVVVYGYEYFFGGGIQATTPGSTQAGRPLRVVKLGVTHITQDVFHDFLRNVSNKYTQQTYNLLNNNCNNFSNAVSNFLLDKDIPEYILNLPQEALNTPLGQSFAPMLASMQNQMAQNVVPWGSSTLALPPINKNPPMGYSEDKEEKSSTVKNDNKEQEAKDKKKDMKSETKKHSNGKHSHEEMKLKAIKPISKPMTYPDQNAAKFLGLLQSFNKKMKASKPDMALKEDELKTLTGLKGTISKKEVVIPKAVSEGIDKLLLHWPSKFLFPVVGVYEALLLRPAQCEIFIGRMEKSLPKLFSLLPSESNSKVNTKPYVQGKVLGMFCHMFTNPKLGAVILEKEEFLEVLISALESKETLVRVPAARLLVNVCITISKSEEENECVFRLANFLPYIIGEESRAQFCSM